MAGILDAHRQASAQINTGKPEQTQENLTSEGEVQQGTSEDSAKNTIEQTGPVEKDPSGVFQPELGNSPERTEDTNTGATVEQLDQGLVEGAVGTAGNEAIPVEMAVKKTELVPIKRETTRRSAPRAESEVLAEERGETEPAVQEPVAAYKHREVRHFKVGQFEFRNHLLYIFTDESNEAFLDAYDGLEIRDQNNIVSYDWQAAASVETAVGTKTQRGAMSTSRLKDPKVIS